MDGALPSICKEKTCIFGSDRNLDPLKNDIWCMLCILKGERERVDSKILKYMKLKLSLSTSF